MEIYLSKRIPNSKRPHLFGESEHLTKLSIDKIRDFTIKQLANFLFEEYGSGNYYAVYNHRYTGRFQKLFYITVSGFNNFELRPGGTIKRYCKLD